MPSMITESIEANADVGSLRLLDEQGNLTHEAVVIDDFLNHLDVSALGESEALEDLLDIVEDEDGEEHAVLPLDLALESLDQDDLESMFLNYLDSLPEDTLAAKAVKASLFEHYMDLAGLDEANKANIKASRAKAGKAAKALKAAIGSHGFKKGQLTKMAKQPKGSAPQTAALRMLLAMRKKEVIKYDAGVGHQVKDVGYPTGGTPAGKARVAKYKQGQGIAAAEKAAKKEKAPAKKNANGKVATKTVKAVIKGKGAEKKVVTKKGKKTEADESEMIGSIIFGHAEPIHGLTHIAAMAEELDQETLDAIEEAKKKKNGLLKTPGAGPAPKQPKNCGPGTKGESYNGDAGLVEGAALASKAVKQLLG